MPKPIRKAVMPVAGLGTRVLPGAKTVAKELLNVVDRPIIAYAVAEARAAGIEHIVMVTGRGKQALEDYFDHHIELEAQLADRNVTIETTDEAADWLAKNGFDELYGARPLARVIQQHIKQPLADEILFGKLVRGGHVKVILKDGKLAFEYDHASGGPEAAGAGESEPALAE